MVARQHIVSLGFVIDSVKMTITLTEERKQYIYMLCQNILSNYQATIRELAQTIRVIVSSFRAIPYGQMYYKELKKKKKCKVQSLATSDGMERNFVRKAYIPEEAANKLKWWIRNAFDAFAPIKLPPFDLTLFSDASSEGFELQAVFFCLKAFCKNKTKLHVKNTSAVAYINKKKGGGGGGGNFSLL